MPDIFLSYNREDQPRAKVFADAFATQGFDVWWDVGLKAGEAYDQVTETALRTAKAVVVLWSPRSVASRWVRAEATLADRNKTLVPCMIEACERPIMFELTQTAELSHWKGDPADAAWLAFLADLKRFVEVRAEPLPAAAAPPPAASARASRDAERRQVAVLSCGLSLPLDSEMDPEDWQEAVAAFRTRAEAVVSPLGGRLIDAPGDGVLVFFGADQSREDDAERAVRAGLAILGAIRGTETLSGRAGVDVGPVVLGAGRAAPAGPPIGASAQLQAQAPPDGVLLSPAAATLVGGYFELEAHGARAFRVAAAHPGRTRFDISRARGLSSFVGRANDFHTLEAALAQAAAGNGQVIGIVAEAGAGKSRLCFEFTEHCRSRGLPVFEGRAVAHGRNIPFLPILDVFRSFFGIRADDDAGAARARIDLRLAGLDAKLASAAPLVFEFLGIADSDRPAPKLDPEARQRQLLGLMRHLIKLAGDEQPTVTLVEDLHWMDAASGAFLDQMVEAREGSRSLLLLNFRPEYQADWTKNSWYRQIPLAPLGHDAVGELLTDLLGTDPSLAPLAAMIKTRTKGNPFFVEEIVQNLIETKHLLGGRGAFRLVTAMDKLEVPPTVKAVLAARIDRLAERDRKLLQTASVIGKDFAEPVLAAVSDLPPDDLRAALAALRRAEFIQEQSLFPVAEHAFRHPLTQEVAYAGLMKDRRRQTHAAVARVIEAQDADHLDERSALLAHHREQAGEMLAAARWHARAAQWAGLTNAAEALRHWQSARRLLRAAPQTAATVQFGVAACMGALGLSWRLGTPKAEITEVFEEGLKLAEASNDITAQAALNGIYGCFLGLVEGQSDDYCRYAAEGIRLAAQTSDQGLQIAQRAFFGFGTVLAGRLREGLASCEWSFEHLPADPELGKPYSGYSPYLGLLNAYAWMLVRSGRITEGRAAIAKVEALARECSDFEILTWLGLPNAEMAVACADAVAARAYVDTSRVSGEKSATPQSRMASVAIRGAACRLEGHWDAAVAGAGEAVELAAAGANREFEGWVRSELALALLGQGDIDGAERQAELSAEVARSQPSRFDEIRGHLAFIRVQLARGGEPALARADVSLARAQSLTDEFEINVYLAELHECRGRIALARGDAAASQSELEQARQRYREMGATLQLDRLARGFA